MALTVDYLTKGIVFGVFFLFVVCKVRDKLWECYTEFEQEHDGGGVT